MDSRSPMLKNLFQVTKSLKRDNIDNNIICVHALNRNKRAQ